MHCVSKNVPLLQRAIIFTYTVRLRHFFGTNVAEKVGNQNVLVFSHHIELVLLHYLGKQEPVPCRISSRLKWYKNYKNRLRLARVIVKNKLPRFYGSLCMHIQWMEHLLLVNGYRWRSSSRWSDIWRSPQMFVYIFELNVVNTVKTINFTTLRPIRTHRRRGPHGYNLMTSRYL